MVPSQGFTLIEILVVSVILALLLGMIIPRLGGGEQRRLRHVAEQVADLMTVYAQRDQLGSRAVALSYHPPPRNMLELVVLDADPSNLFAPPLWRTEPFASPVLLPEDITILQPQVDGLTLSDSNWAIVNMPGQDRPMIELTLASPELTSTIALPPHSMSPRFLEIEQRFDVERTPIDLDLAGRGREDW
jgi:prepilin-type N-terminal cleavage/methylation domain-containing protein